MGFECGFEVVPRINNISAKQYIYASLQHNYNKNTILHDLYNSFEDYFIHVNDSECEYPDQNNLVDIYSKKETELIDNWYSYGRVLDDEFIQGKLEKIKPFEYYELSKNQVEEILKAVNKSLKEEKLIPATVSYAVFDREDEERILRPCDGILVEDDHGNQRLLDFKFDNIWVPEKYFDIDYHYTKESFRDALEKLFEYDFNRNIIFYYRSY